MCVAIDEIDKADPDVPNNLLVPTGSLSFPGLPHPTESQLNNIAAAHFGSDGSKKTVYKSFARKTMELQTRSARSTPIQLNFLMPCGRPCHWKLPRSNVFNI
jgi:hypothetical protein